MAQSLASDILKEGFLTKQGGVQFTNWKKRWFVLKEESLIYYKEAGDAKVRKTIDLKQGRGVRTKDCCSLKTWPGDATFCFCLATTKRTWYFYGSEDKDIKEWSELIQQCIEKVGTPDGDWGKDPNGKPEGAVSKALRHTVKCAANIAKDLIPSTGNEHVDAAIKTGLNVVEKQADADAKTSMKDRVKMGGKSVISGVADSVDIPDVSVAANVPQLPSALGNGLGNPAVPVAANVPQQLSLALGNRLGNPAVSVAPNVPQQWPVTLGNGQHNPAVSVTANMPQQWPVALGNGLHNPAVSVTANVPQQWPLGPSLTQQTVYS